MERSLSAVAWSPRTALLLSLALALSLFFNVACGGRTGANRADAPLVLSAPALNFRDCGLGEVQVQQLTVTNPAPHTVTLLGSLGDAGGSLGEFVGEAAREYSIVAPAHDPAGGGGLAIAAGASATLDVQHDAVSGGTRHAELHLPTDDSAQPPLVIPLEAFVYGCAYDVDPPALDFGVLRPGTVHELVLRIRNSSPRGESCTFENVSIREDSPEAHGVFTVLADSSYGYTLGSPGEWLLTLRAKVSEPGTFHGTLAFTVDTDVDRDIPHGIELSAAGDACTSVSALGIDFDEVPVGCTSKPKVLAISSLCDAGITIADVALRNGETSPFVLSPPANATATKTSDWKLEVAYRPTAVAASDDAIVVRTADGAQYVFWVRGEGIPVMRAETFDQPRAMDVLFVVDGASASLDLDARTSLLYAALKTALDARGLDWKIGQLWGARADGSGPSDGWLSQIETPAQRRALTAGARTGGAFLEAARRALSYSVQRGHNAGFLRESAALAVVVATNDRDESASDAETYAKEFLASKGEGRRNDVWFASLAPLQRVPPPAYLGCTYESGFDARLICDVSRQLYGRVEDVCAPETQIPRLLGGARRSFVLAARPDMTDRSRLIVEINGVPLPPTSPTGAVQWSYNGMANVVDIADSIPMPIGARVSVIYPQACQ